MKFRGEVCDLLRDIRQQEIIPDRNPLIDISYDDCELLVDSLQCYAVDQNRPNTQRENELIDIFVSHRKKLTRRAAI